MGKNAFDLHFSSREYEDDKKEYEYHHKLSFKEDVIEVMRRCGKIPYARLEDNVRLIEEKAKLEESHNLQAQEIEKLKSANTAAMQYESKF